jgi:hypothetical protein
MAIIIEPQERRGGNILSFLLWGVFILALFAGLYYVFFTKPELIDIATPRELKDAQEIANIKFDPNALASSPQFKALRPYVTEPSLPALGRSNPFIAP